MDTCGTRLEPVRITGLAEQYEYNCKRCALQNTYRLGIDWVTIGSLTIRRGSPRSLERELSDGRRSEGPEESTLLMGATLTRTVCVSSSSLPSCVN